MTLLLNGFYLALLVFVSPWILWRTLFQRRYRTGWDQKLFGNVPERGPKESLAHDDCTGATVWIHAVSVGELQVIRPLIERITHSHPETQLVVSTSTDTGMELASRLYSGHTVIFAPLDFSWAVSKAMRRIRPDLIVLAELELWPNWLRTAHRLGCPVVVMNARIGEKSFAGYSRIQRWLGPILRNIDWIGCQTDTYRDRFLKLGCSADRVVVTGNTKFDGASNDRHHPEIELRREYLKLQSVDIVWLAGSTQAPEEQLVLDTFVRLHARYPQLKLLLVPRHAERFDEVARFVDRTGLAWARRSQSAAHVSSPDWTIFLGDTVGELRWWWGLADIGFVGGSFGSRGGQNMIEPCAYGVATSFGPNTRNFVDTVKILLDAGAAKQFDAPEELEPWIAHMIESDAERIALAERAVVVTQKHRGAIDRTWNGIEPFLKIKAEPKSCKSI